MSPVTLVVQRCFRWQSYPFIFLRVLVYTYSTTKIFSFQKVDWQDSNLRPSLTCVGILLRYFRRHSKLWPLRYNPPLLWVRIWTLHSVFQLTNSVLNCALPFCHHNTGYLIPRTRTWTFPHGIRAKVLSTYTISDNIHTLASVSNVALTFPPSHDINRSLDTTIWILFYCINVLTVETGIIGLEPITLRLTAVRSADWTIFPFL